MLVDLVKVIIASTGTGPLALGAAVQSFDGVDALVDGETYSYSIQINSLYEAGQGTFFAIDNSLSRQVSKSSSGGAPINVPANATVTFTALAKDFARAAVGGAMQQSANLSDVANLVQARQNLGIPNPVQEIDVAAYTLQLQDAETYIRFSNAGQVTVTVPDDTSEIPVNTVIAFEQTGAGAVKLVAAPGVTLNGRGATNTTPGQFAVGQIKKTFANTWTVLGDMA